jgi:hypothetical protein
MLNKTRARIRLRICDGEPELPAAVTDSIASALVVRAHSAQVFLPLVAFASGCLGHDVLLPQLSEGLLRSPWWEDGRGDSARSLLTSSVHSVCEVLGIQKTDGLKESDSRLVRPEFALEKWTTMRKRVAGRPFAAKFAWSQFLASAGWARSAARCGRLPGFIRNRISSFGSCRVTA